ncbi:MAG: hypothetical protein E6J90_44775 [Deltaproteobacteria bacterium]|nr:MAG: hypothetical protein E6J90_44775 [Deltaproteobacteria bacterium]TMQ22525.1 MAG: hypothetical protein E6J91_01230 [Deltaproteobacteria bacterium]
MAAQLESRRGPGFVFAIDDLELDNVETPGNVAGVVRDAVVRALGSTPTHAEQARYRERCSFHLLCPMVEAYFYGEPAALTRAGAHAPALVVQTEHLEAFLAGDMAYLVPPDEPGHAWRSPGRAKHPKRYLRFLAMPDRYQEAKGGRDALATLDWRQVFDRQPPGLGFALALFEDLADAIGVPCPFRGEARSETARRVDGVLCNL